jgi:hypothetical protein
MGKIDGQMSQSPVVWWYRKVNCEVVGMCVEAISLLGAESVKMMMTMNKVKRKFFQEVV